MVWLASTNLKLNLVYTLNWKQTTKDLGWNITLSIGGIDKLSTIASFSADGIKTCASVS